MAGLTREQIAERDAAKAEKVELPATKPYRVAIGGAMYARPQIVTSFDGTESIVYPSVLGYRGERIDLIPREAKRLMDLDAVRPADEPLTYEEMNDEQLDAAVKAVGVRVTSSGADQDKPLRVDKINALRTFDQGRGVAQP